MRKYFIVITVLTMCTAFGVYRQPGTGGPDPVPIPPSIQRAGGDIQKGYDYLLTGDYVRGGIPMNIFKMAIGKSKPAVERSGLNSNIPHDYTAIKASNGEILVAPNCLQCHAQEFDGKLYIGLGNTFADFTPSQKYNMENLDKVSKLLKTMFPRKYEAAAPFLRVTKAIGPLLNTEVRGVNPADRLAAALAVHRDPVTFRWVDTASVQLPQQVIATDVPPWWLLKKKNAMFYNGAGRGDFGRFLMASNLLTVSDTAESAEVDKHMPDLLAYINSLQPPPYPRVINQQLAGEGRLVFANNCARCHGTYEKDNTTYPNLLIPGPVIQTDPLLYQANFAYPQFVNWFNQSWFTKGDHAAQLSPFNGYIAPPLDGIWVTAPYLHNGSVPTLDALLNSPARPDYWSRDFEKPAYNYEKIGWQYTTHTNPGGGTVYNTTLPGYSNDGHYFGDALTEAERKAVIEYLKTL